MAVKERGGAGVGKIPINPMNAVYPYQQSPRCKATSKRTRKPCQAPAVNGWAVCRFHGARGGAPKAQRNGRYRHGLYTAESIGERKGLRSLLQSFSDFQKS